MFRLLDVSLLSERSQRPRVRVGRAQCAGAGQAHRRDTPRGPLGGPAGSCLAQPPRVSEGLPHRMPAGKGHSELQSCCRRKR